MSDDDLIEQATRVIAEANKLSYDYEDFVEAARALAAAGLLQHPTPAQPAYDPFPVPDGPRKHVVDLIDGKITNCVNCGETTHGSDGGCPGASS